MRLIPCSSCKRHVRDDTCPFCGAAVDLASAPPERRAFRGGRNRSAILLGTALALAGCDSGTSSGMDAAIVDADVPDDAWLGGGDAAYGAPGAGPRDASPVDDAMIGADGALYGGPPTDASTSDAGDDAGAAVNLYGAPPFEP